MKLFNYDVPENKKLCIIRDCINLNTLVTDLQWGARGKFLGPVLQPTLFTNEIIGKLINKDGCKYIYCVNHNNTDDLVLLDSENYVIPVSVLFNEVQVLQEIPTLESLEIHDNVQEVEVIAEEVNGAVETVEEAVEEVNETVEDTVEEVDETVEEAVEEVDEARVDTNYTNGNRPRTKNSKR